MCIDPATALAEVRVALQLFDCEQGDPRAFHTTPEGVQHRYVTLGFKGKELHAVAAALRAELQRVKGLCVPNIKPTLYLRSGPAVERDFETKDWHMRMRLAIPNFDWSEITTKPEGLPYPQAQ